MAFKANLELDGQAYRLLHCSYSLRRNVDSTGRPSSAVMGGTVHLEIESTDDTNIWDILISHFKTVDGKIVFKKRDEEAKMKELIFENAYIIDYTEQFDADGGNPMTIRFTLSAQKLTLGAESHKNEWPI